MVDPRNRIILLDPRSEDPIHFVMSRSESPELFSPDPTLLESGGTCGTCKTVFVLGGTTWRMEARAAVSEWGHGLEDDESKGGGLDQEICV